MGDKKYYEKRIEQLREILSKRKLSAIMVNSGGFTVPNIYYFTGYYDMASAMLLVTKDEARLYAKYESALEESRIETVRMEQKQKFSGILKKEKLDLKRIGFDGSISYSFFGALAKKLPKLRFVDVAEEIGKVRAIKDDMEINCTKDACRLTDKILSKLPLHSGNESDIEHKIKEEVIRLRTEEAFPPIAAGDVNSSNVHYFRNNCSFKDNLLLDIGVKAGHYCSDVSRTFALSGNPEIKKAIRTLAELQGELDDFVRPGIKAGAVHKFASDYLDKAGYKDENFKNFHRMGHGVGIEIHEWPSFGPEDETVLRENMVVTLEPALYFRGRFGARIEDTVLLKKNGIERLSKFKSV